jgi:hypothetical protein
VTKSGNNNKYIIYNKLRVQGFPGSDCRTGPIQVVALTCDYQSEEHAYH